MSETNNIVWYDSVLPITLGIKPLPARTPKAKADAYYNACKQEISKIISAYKSYYYSVGIRDGHNGGFFLNISQHRVWQSEAVGREETTRLKQCLMACADAGLVKCDRDEDEDPHHTYYASHDDTIILIEEALEVDWRTLRWILAE